MISRAISAASNTVSLGGRARRESCESKPATIGEKFQQCKCKRVVRTGPGAISILTYRTGQVAVMPEIFLDWQMFGSPSITTLQFERRKRRGTRVAASWPPLSDVQTPLATPKVTLHSRFRHISELGASITQRLSCWSELSSAFLIMGCLFASDTSVSRLGSLSAPAIWFPPPNWPYLFFSGAYNQVAWDAISRPSSCVACSSGRASYAV